MGQVATLFAAAALLFATACRSASDATPPRVEPSALSPSASAALARIEGAVRRYASDRAGRLPATLDDLVREGPPEGGGRYLRQVPLDPWGRPYSYAVIDPRIGAFDLRSAGPDTLPGTDDDVVGARRAVPVGTSEAP